MRVLDLIEQSTITTVWRVLGGGDIKSGRGRAWWRDGDGLTVSIDAERGRWYDHRDHIGGGILRLIQHVRGGSIRDALRWLADLHGVTLDGRAPLSAQDRQRYAQARRDATELARAAGLWWIERRESLERAKAEAVEHGDIDGLARAAREHYRLSRFKGNGAAIVREYLSASQEEPEHTAALVAEGERWSRLADALATLCIARWARDAGAAT